MKTFLLILTTVTVITLGFNYFSSDKDALPTFILTPTIQSGPTVQKLEFDIPVKNLSIDADQLIFLNNMQPVMPDSAFRVIKEINEKSKLGKELYLVLESPGGSVFDGGKIITAMESAKVNTVTVGLCASMCAIIHQHGVKRYMFKRSLLMFHPAAGGVEGTLEQMQSRLSFITNFVNKENIFISKRAGLTYEQFKTLYVTEHWIDADDSINTKFADGLVYFPFESGDVTPINIGEKKTDKSYKFFEVTN